MQKMTAMLYQEWICKKKSALFSLMVPLIFQAFPFFALLVSPDMHSDTGSIDDSTVHIVVLIQCIFFTFSYFVNVTMILSPIMLSNERKNWGRFVLSTPDTSALQVRFYYELAFGILLLTNFLNSFSIALLSSLCNTAIQLPSILNTILFFVVLLFNAIDFPCYIAFTKHRGDKVHTLLFLLAILLLIVYALFGELSFIADNSDSLFEKLFSLLNADKLSNGLYVFMAVLTPLSIVAYLFSYRLSCKYYRKGVLQYEK